MSSTIFFTPGSLWPFTNTHSACVAAKRLPRADEPAWYSTGVRCGEGSLRCIASTLYCLPLWCTTCTLDGSAYTPLALVAQHGAVFPAAFPELVDQLHVFVGQVVAVVVRIWPVRPTARAALSR
jgi:hypothetical protein